MADEAVTGAEGEGGAGEGAPADDTLLTGAEGEGSDDNANADDKSGDDADDSKGEDKSGEDTDDKPDEEKDDEPEGAPESYADFTMPEGIELDATAADKFKEVAKKHNLSQAAAQELVDIVGDMQQRLVDTIITQREAWLTESKADAEFGGDKLDATLGTAKRALDAFGSDKLKTLLNESGLGNHPEVIRFMFKAGSAVSEDNLVRGHGATGNDQRSLAERIYGKKE